MNSLYFNIVWVYIIYFSSLLSSAFEVYRMLLTGTNHESREIYAARNWIKSYFGGGGINFRSMYACTGIEFPPDQEVNHHVCMPKKLEALPSVSRIRAVHKDSALALHHLRYFWLAVMRYLFIFLLAVASWGSFFVRRTGLQVRRVSNGW